MRYLTIAIVALTTIVTAHPSARANSFNGDICSTDGDCPSDFPFCQGSFLIINNFPEPAECIMQCSNDNTQRIEPTCLTSGDFPTRYCNNNIVAGCTGN
ncbi:hypothetical protein B0H19DRAFT_1258504 [Mycena capillaripes]|nr:hypothetical protein B0H19DRAFT_1258504 [Mycena capillaripes]